jgi:hypothetical protein
VIKIIKHLKLAKFIENIYLLEIFSFFEIYKRKCVGQKLGYDTALYFEI